MNLDARNRIGLVTLTVVLAATAVVALLWLAAPMRITLADDPPGISGEDAVNQGPTSQIWSPVRDAIIRQTEALTISGYAWDEGIIPPFITDDLELSIRRVDEWNYWVSWTDVLTEGLYILEEAQTPDFDGSSKTFVEAPADSEFVSKQSGEEGRYYYRVQATKDTGDSRWSNVASVEVPWTETGSVLEITAVANGTFTVEVRIDGGEWYTAPVTSEGWGGWSWAYAWGPLPEEQGVQHVIETRATNGLGEVGAVDAISVTVSNQEYILYFPQVAHRWPPIPYAPTLDAIGNPDKDDSYTVSWSYDPGDPPIDADNYTLQEDTNAGFTSPTEYTVAWSTSPFREFSGKGPGVYYYRVRGNNAYGPGEWSNVVSTEVVEPGFVDDFSSTSTGWPQTTYRRGTSPDGDVMTVGYTSGRYRMKILLDTLGFNNKRMGIVKSPFDNPYGDYDVEVDHYFERASDQTVDPTWGKGGLIFGANSTFSTIYVVEWHFPSGSDAPQCAVYKYNQVLLPTSIVWLAGGTPLQNWVACTGLKGGFNQTNRIRVEVRGSQATVYINSTKLGSFIDAGIASNHKVGLMTGSWERTPVESRFDNFAVTPR